MVEGWELQGGPAASSMEAGVVTPQSVRGLPTLFRELKRSHFRLCMYLTFFSFRVKVLEALHKNLEEKSCLNRDPSA